MFLLKIVNKNFLKSVSKFSLNYCKPVSNYLFKMDKAYLRDSQDGEHFDLSFELKNEQIKRKFNFSRKLSESVEIFLIRVKANLDKAISRKKKKNTPLLPPTINVDLLINETPVLNTLTCADVFHSDNVIQLNINDKSFHVIVNSPWVLTLNLPSSILATFPTYPTKFDTVFTNNEISEFVWYKSKNNVQWTEVGRDFIFIPDNECIEHFLKFSCTPKNDRGLIGPVFDTVSSCKVEAAPRECPFEKRQLFTKKKLKGNEFRVVSYNILADLYCDSDYTREVLFPYCPPYALSIDYRKQLFLKEIIGYNADLMCLQEVDKKIFNNDLQPTLSYLGYGSNFYTKGNEVAEGLAFFYNRNRFILLDSEKLLFSDQLVINPIFKDIWEKIKTNDQLAARILARSTTMQLNIVGSLENDEILVVANIHLYFHPDSDHIRLLHACLAIQYLENFVQKAKNRYVGKRVSLIFCGDFNSVPSCGIYELYTNGFIPGNFIDYSSNKDETIENINITQPFKLKSACGTPKYTNFTAGFAACLDYIYYDSANLGVSQIIPFPTDEELTENTAIPSILFPSDHIALISDLKWS